MRLIATRSFRYATRHLEAGDEFESTEREAKVLIAIKRAREAPQKVVAPKPPKAPEVDERELESLRQRAVGLGIIVDGRWGVRRLQDEIAAKVST